MHAGRASCIGIGPQPIAPRQSVSVFLFVCICCVPACSKRLDSETGDQRNPTSPDKPSNPSGAIDSDSAGERARQAEIEKNYPLHGLVTGTQIKVNEEPDSDSAVFGWLRIGSRIRLSKERKRTRTCASGWYRIYPFGWACAGLGIEVGSKPPDSAFAIAPAPKDAALPYTYYFVKEPLVPEYFRLPSRNEQRVACDFADHYLKLKEKKPKTAERLLRGELPQGPTRPTVVRRYLERGFFVAGAARETRAQRHFIRTVQGSSIKLAQLERRRGSSFRGVDLDENHQLPIAWAVRAARPFTPKQRADGSWRFVADAASEPFQRLSILPWQSWERIGESVLHKLTNGLYLKFWFAAVAERIELPKGITDREPWVHVDISQQTLVLYRGSAPVYATLVSTGLEGHDTPIGVYEIRSKHVAATMSDLGPEAGDERYKIEDVPWTQYLKGSLALHGAFWHERFGLRRSHGCINLSPLDAHRVFDHTWPEVPEGWHGVSTDITGLPKSKVVITE